MKTIRNASAYESIAACRVEGSNEGIIDVECLVNNNCGINKLEMTFEPGNPYRTASIMLAASGPVIRALSAFRRIACNTAPLKETPMTCPVVRNRYVTIKSLLALYSTVAKVITYSRSRLLSPLLRRLQSSPETDLTSKKFSPGSQNLRSGWL